MAGFTLGRLMLQMILSGIPVNLLAQNAQVTSFRPYVSVLIAFAVSWVMVAAWVFRIGRKVNRLVSDQQANSDRS